MHTTINKGKPFNKQSYEPSGIKSLNIKINSPHPLQHHLLSVDEKKKKKKHELNKNFI